VPVWRRGLAASSGGGTQVRYLHSAQSRPGNPRLMRRDVLTIGIQTALGEYERSKAMKTKTNVKAGNNKKR
jgi:hypothetical protein